MAAHDFFLSLLIILLTARIFAELATRLQAPSVIGELFAGVVLGPSLLGWIEPTEAIRLMAGIGIILLLFEVGLETDLKRLVHTGLESIVVAVAGFVLPFLLGFGLAYGLFELPLLVSLFIGGTLDRDQYRYHRASARRPQTPAFERGTDRAGCGGPG